MTEVELCSAVKAANLFPGFTLHEEVGISGVSCDMVFENGKEVYCVEAKLHFNFEVLAQACRWRGVATASFVAVPVSAVHGWWRSPKKAVLEELGLGLIWVDSEGASFGPSCNPFDGDAWSTHAIYKYVADWEYWGPCISRIGANLTPAGSKLGKRSTTFSRTIDALKNEAIKHPEYTLKQLLAVVPTHYNHVTSACQVLKNYAKHHVIEKFWRDE